MFKKVLCLLCVSVFCLTLFGCGRKKAVIDPTEIITLPAPTETEAPTNPNEDIETLTVVLSAGEIYTLNQYPNLKSVDLSGSTGYATILEYIQEHPEVDVTYTVDLGGTTVSNKASSAVLEPGSFSYDTLLENLQYLPNLTTISLP